MTNWKCNGTRLALAAAAFACVTALAAPQAEAHGRGGRGRPVSDARVFYTQPYFSFGFGYYSPFFHPYYWGFYGPYAYHHPEGGVDLNVAMIAGFGALDLNVKPGEAEVWVDGKYIGAARDLDGSPTFLWLEEGEHRVQIYRGGYVTFDERFEVQRGVKRELKVRMEKGEARLPGPRPAANADTW